MTLFRPCIDIHAGVVKQIVGSSLSDASPSDLKTNFVASHPPSYFAQLYKENNLRGGHVIKLSSDPASDAAAKDALRAFPNGLHIGGGVNLDNAQGWIDNGAEKVIVTSWLFPSAKFDEERLRLLSEKLGRQQVVVDVSCKRTGTTEEEPKWTVAMNKWQTLTDMEVNEESLSMLSNYCSEFLIHAADVEGKQQGIDSQLVDHLGKWLAATKVGCCYAGGGKSITDLDLVASLSNWSVDLTFGSALDIFGGKGVTLDECIEWNRTKGGARHVRTR